MARIAPAVDPTTLATGDLSDIDRVNLEVGAIMAHRPEVQVALGQAMGALTTTGTLGPRLHELVRLRIAFHNQCRSCMAVRYVDRDDGFTEDLVCSLERPAEAPDLTEAERAALRYADLFATEHLRIDDAVHDDLRRYFDEGQLVELGVLCGLCVGIGRLAATWHVVDDLPERFRADGTVTPWGPDALLAGAGRSAARS